MDQPKPVFHIILVHLLSHNYHVNYAQFSMIHGIMILNNPRLVKFVGKALYEIILVIVR